MSFSESDLPKFNLLIQFFRDWLTHEMAKMAIRRKILKPFPALTRPQSEGHTGSKLQH